MNNEIPAYFRDKLSSIETTCKECDGTGEIECPHCGSDVECDECNEDGYILNDVTDFIDRKIEIINIGGYVECPICTQFDVKKCICGGDELITVQEAEWLNMFIDEMNGVYNGL